MICSPDGRWWRLVLVVLIMSFSAVTGGQYQARAADQTVVLVPSSNPLSGNAEAIVQGRKLYFTWCVQCHGKKADGVAPRWGKYAKDLRKFSAGYSEFFAIVVSGRPKKKMPAWGEIIKPEDIQRIGTYLETLAIEGANWKDR